MKTYIDDPFYCPHCDFYLVYPPEKYCKKCAHHYDIQDESDPVSDPIYCNACGYTQVNKQGEYCQECTLSMDSDMMASQYPDGYEDEVAAIAFWDQLFKSYETKIAAQVADIDIASAAVEVAQCKFKIAEAKLHVTLAESNIDSEYSMGEDPSKIEALQSVLTETKTKLLEL